MNTNDDTVIKNHAGSQFHATAINSLPAKRIEPTVVLYDHYRDLRSLMNNLK